MRAVAAYVLVAVLAGILFSYDHVSQSQYHSKTLSNAREALSGKSNFRHPVLIVSTTRLVGALAGTPRGVIDYAVVGGLVSAAFGVIAVLALMALAHLRYGLLAATGAGLLLATNVHLVVYSHYLKEDAALTCGVALALLALDRLGARPDRGRIVWLGIACGIAASAKYVGFVCLCLAIPFVLRLTPLDAALDRKRRLRALLIPALIVIVIANYTVWFQLPRFWGGLSYEIAHVTTGADGSGRPAGSKDMAVFTILLGALSPVLLAGALAYLVMAVTPRFRFAASQRYLAWFPPIYLGLLSLSLYGGMVRHQLPALAVIEFLAVAALFELTRRLGWRQPARVSVVLVLLLAVLPMQWSETRSQLETMRDSPRTALRAWASENLPASAVIAQDWNARLPDSEDRTEGGLWSGAWSVHTFKQFGSEIDLEGLRELGYSHVVVSPTPYRDPEDEAPEPEAFRRFYRELTSEATLIGSIARSRGPAAPGAIPEFEVYSLDHDAPAR